MYPFYYIENISLRRDKSLNNSYLSNVEDSVPLYREEIIVVVIFVVVVVAGGEGNRGEFTRTGVSLKGSKPLGEKSYTHLQNLNRIFCTNDFIVTDQLLFPVLLVHLPDRRRSRRSDDSLMVGWHNIQMAKALKVMGEIRC